MNAGRDWQLVECLDQPRRVKKASLGDMTFQRLGAQLSASQMLRPKKPMQSDQAKQARQAFEHQT